MNGAGATCFSLVLSFCQDGPGPVAHTAGHIACVERYTRTHTTPVVFMGLSYGMQRGGVTGVLGVSSGLPVPNSGTCAEPRLRLRGRNQPFRFLSSNSAAGAWLLFQGNWQNLEAGELLGPGGNLRLKGLPPIPALMVLGGRPFALPCLTFLGG